MGTSRHGLGRVALLVALAIGLVACAQPVAINESETLAPVSGATTVRTPANTPIEGMVSFGSQVAFTTQAATMSDVAMGATVSLIDQATGNTIAATISDATGHFLLSYSTFTPAAGRAYYLEAVKGLNNNSASSPAMRVRTLIQWVNGWVSMTNPVAGGPINLNVGTTALSVITSLRAATPTPVNVQFVAGVNNEIGTVSASSPPTFVPGTLNVTQSEFQSVVSLVNQAFNASGDPLYTITYNIGSGTYQQQAPGGSGGGSGGIVANSISPTTGTVGTPFTLAGQGFSSTLASNSVKFCGGVMPDGSVKPPATANLTSCSGTTLSGTVPSGAVTGQVTVQVGNQVALGPTFTIPPVITSFSPATGYAGNSSITLSGTSFDPTLVNDSLYFTGPDGAYSATGSVTAVTSTSMTVTVPPEANTGKIKLVTPGGTAISATSFTATPYVAALSALKGTPGTLLTITGGGFGATQGTSQVLFNGAAYPVTSWGNTSIRVAAPAAGGVYPVSVRVSSLTSNATNSFTVLAWVNAGKNSWDPSGNFYYPSSGYGTIYKIPAGQTTSAAFLTTSGARYNAAVMGPDNKLWVADSGWNSISKIDTSTKAVTKVLDIASPTAMAWSSDNDHLFIVAGGNLSIYSLSANAITATALHTPTPPSDAYNEYSNGLEQVACDSKGNAWVIEGRYWDDTYDSYTSNYYVGKVTATGGAIAFAYYHFGGQCTGISLDKDDVAYLQEYEYPAGYVISKLTSDYTAKATFWSHTMSNTTTGIEANHVDGFLYVAGTSGTQGVFKFDPAAGSMSPWVNTSYSARL